MIADSLLGVGRAIVVLAILGLTLAAFIWNRLRYDVVALLALLAAVLAGAVPANQAFLGFGHPAVITVAAVLVLSRGLQLAGVVSLLTRQLARIGRSVTLQVGALTTAIAVLSAFMNNVGALALLMPVAMKLCRDRNQPASQLLMPLAFGSLLGGLLTLIGTPANIIISTFRAERVGSGFGMFAFLPVGGGVALAGILYLALIGWRLIPRRRSRRSAEDLFETSSYLSELTVLADSKAAGWTIAQLRQAYGEPVPLVAVIRNGINQPPHTFNDRLMPGDTLLVETEPDELQDLVARTGLQIGSRRFTGKLSEIAGIDIAEAVVRPGSQLVGRTASDLALLDRHGLNLLAVARDGSRLNQRLSQVRFEAGDVLLLQGDPAMMADSLVELGCLPLVSRGLSVGQPRRLTLALAIFVAALVAILTGLLSPAVALMLAAALNVLAGIVPPREVYNAIDWSVIVLLGALIPLSQALETSGAARLLAHGLLVLGHSWPPTATLALLFVATMLLSNVINNAAAALLMAPVAYDLAIGFGASPDPFLMTVAVSASCAFLTPIGHQSNTLVLGPGGYCFGDYWPSGLPLSAIATATTVLLVLRVWPLGR